MIHFRTATLGILLLAACVPLSDGNGLDGPGMIRLTAERPEGAASDSCWGKKTSPAIIETVEREVLLKPAYTGAKACRKSCKSAWTRGLRCPVPPI